MNLAQYSSSTQYQASGLPSTVGGTVIIAVAQLLGMPLTHAMEPQEHQTISRTYSYYGTPDTQHSSKVEVGLLQDQSSALISDAAKAAIGSEGYKRLENFFRLSGGWDGSASKPIDLNSVGVFSKFFAETAICPNQLGVFMSSQGNVVVNWQDQDNQLVELEFLPSGIEYFIERSGEEGTVPAGDIGFTKLLHRVAGTVGV